MTYAHDGDILANVDGTSRHAKKHWNNLKNEAYDLRWMIKFQMTEATFDELLVLVQKHMQDSRVNQKVPLTIDIVVVASIMRCPWRMYQQSNSLRVDC